MGGVRVARLHSRYRLPPAAGPERARLDGVLIDVLNSRLEPVVEQALSWAGIGSTEEVCVRSLRVPVVLRLRWANAGLVEAWTEAIGGVIRRLIEEGGPDVVRYPSRAHALLDLCCCVALRDHRRAWAWRQLGLWEGSAEPTDAASAEGALRALVSEPQLIVPIVAVMARRGLVPALAELVPESWWTIVAEAALSAGGASGELVRPIGSGQLLRRRVAMSTGPSRHRAEAIVASSRLAGAATAVVGPLIEPAGPRRAVAALAVLEADPAAVLMPDGRVSDLIGAVEEALISSAVGVFVAPTVGGDLGGSPIRRTDRSEGAPAERGANDSTGTSGFARETGPSTSPGPQAGGGAERGGRPTEDAGPPRAATPFHRGTPAGSEPAGAQLAEAPPPVGRRWVRTRAGGLLFLIHVVGELGLPGEIDRSAAFHRRTGRWVLHRLGLTLLPLAPGDPAALAFCGMGPEAVPPSALDDPPTPEETSLVEDMGRRVLLALRDRMDRPDGEAEVVLRFVCLRRADIAADPGWIEVRFDPDEVSTEIRRAGLDLDPGYVPWLGTVVRFAYA